jgi:hypothetical protein
VLRVRLFRRPPLHVLQLISARPTKNLVLSRDTWLDTDVGPAAGFIRATLPACSRALEGRPCIRERGAGGGEGGHPEALHILTRQMTHGNSPLLRFNDLNDQTDKDEQEGMMHLFEGAVLALRNPRAHALFDESPELALDYIGLLGLLAKRLDTAKR